MKNYKPEILMGLILCLTLLLAAPPGGTPSAADLPAQKGSASDTAQAAPVSPDRETTVRLVHGEEVRTMSMREYLIGVIMSEMPPSFEPEALRAQAIASRTYALHCRKHAGADICSDGACCQYRLDEQTLRKRFSGDYDAYRERAAQAVDSTDGVVLTYRGELIDATFFACSGGMTEDAVEIWGADVPYLRPVSSPGEENARAYHSRAAFGAEEFAGVIQALAPEAVLTGDPAQWPGATERTAGDGVRTMEIGGAVLTGPEFRAGFHLNSTNFTLQWDGEKFCFDVYGAGHRVGLSQWGAQAMALDGASAEQILKTYYTGVEISHI